MAKVVDDNGYWSIKHNPISAVGVFDYLGSNISDDCEPNRIYKVYRPAETLRESVDTWNNPPKPLILQHEMLGDGFTSTDDRPVQGIISNVEFDENTGKLYGDIAVYSDEMKEAIESGVRELSLGYMCQYKKQPGVYNGQTYDYIQTDMRGNHCAIVEAGRCGSDVRVFDHKCAMDSIDVNPTDFMACENVLNKNENSEKINIDNEDNKKKGENEMADKREAIREIMAIAAKPDSDFEGGETEKIETIAKLLENSEYAKSETGTDEDDVAEEEKKATDKCGKDSKIRRGRRARDEDDSEKKESEDEDDDEEKKAEDEDVSLSDVLAAIKELGDLIKSSKTTDEDDTDEEKKESEDEDDTDEDDDDSKPTGDSRLHVFKKKNAVDADAALQAYLA